MRRVRKRKSAEKEEYWKGNKRTSTKKRYKGRNKRDRRGEV